MFKTMFRGSLFLTLMLIVSITLSGCDLDLSKCIDGIKGALGSVVSGIGNFISKGVDVAKNVLGGVGNFVKEIGKAGGEISDKFGSACDKIGSGIEKVDKALDKVGDVGEKITKAGENLKNSSKKDSAGNKTTDTKTTQKVADPTKDTNTNKSSSSSKSSDSKKENTAKAAEASKKGEVSKNSNDLADFAAMVKKIFGKDATVEIVDADGNTTECTGSSSCSKSSSSCSKSSSSCSKSSSSCSSKKDLSTKEEKSASVSSIKEGCTKITSGLNDVEKVFQGYVNAISADDRKAVIAGIESVKKDIAAITKDPTASDAEEKYNKCKTKLEALKKEINKVNVKCPKAKGLIDTGIEAIESLVSSCDKCLESASK